MWSYLLRRPLVNIGALEGSLLLFGDVIAQLWLASVIYALKVLEAGCFGALIYLF